MKQLANRVFEIRQRLVPNGIQLEGMSRSDRGTKYIVRSLVVMNEQGSDKPSQEAIEKGIQIVLGEGE